MKITFKTQDSGSSGSPVRSEPYEDFFKENGFASPEYNELCDFYSNTGIRVEVTNDECEKINQSVGGLILPIFPIIAAEEVLYVQHTARKITLSVGNPWHSKFGVRDDPAKEVSIIDLGEYKRQLKEGQNPREIMQPSLDALTRANVPHWLGYIVMLGTSGTSQTVVLQEDFKTAESKFLDYTTFLPKVVEEIYGKLSAKKVNAFLRSLPEQQDELGAIFMQSFEQFSNPRALEQRLRKANLIDDEGNPLPGCEEKIKALFDAPYDKWLEKYEKRLATAGLMDAEEELAARVNSYCAENSLAVHVPKEQNYRKQILMTTIEDRTR